MTVSDRPATIGLVPDHPERGTTVSSDATCFDVSGIMTIGLTDASPGDIRAVGRQLGLPPVTPRPPDVMIRFTDRIALEGAVPIGDHAMRTSAGFVVHHHSRHSRSVLIPFDRLGQGGEIVCESGGASVPLLGSIIGLVALAKGCAPVHGSACLAGTRGILTSGWTGGGKTGTALALMSGGATFVSDDVVYVARDGTRMFGLPRPMNVKDVYLDQLPEYRARLPRTARRRMETARSLQAVGRWIPAAIRRRVAPAAVRDHLSRRLQARRATRISPASLFGPQRCRPSGPLDTVVVALGTEQGETELRPTSLADVIPRLCASTIQEAAGLRSYYRHFRFAFPDRVNPWLEDYERHLTRQLTHALAGKSAYLLDHPVPASMRALRQALAPLLEPIPDTRPSVRPA